MEKAAALRAAEEVPWDGEEENQPPDYGSKDYWQKHFLEAPHGASDDPAALEFEWLCSDMDLLVEVLRPYLPQDGRILHPGCGMSLLPLRLWEKCSSRLEFLNVDSSSSCVDAMRHNHGNVSEKLQWKVYDVTQILANDASNLVSEWGPFAGVVEKGCLDALLCSSEEEAAAYVAGLAALLDTGAMLLVVSNSPVRHRHLSSYFEVLETRLLRPEDGPFGPSLYVCCRRRRPAEPLLQGDTLNEMD
eukprot:TRINITY_DN84050_c0_g1_i1.p1 TRINITY_DN84050_c0_g1~~TRINITY_DN84050_c0_g1_i1.p1  ORF type:complete len:246 (+),score=63.64 TRINITY_DN84050_c0_g1_i1:2-739(+)